MHRMTYFQLFWHFFRKLGIFDKNRSWVFLLFFHDEHIAKVWGKIIFRGVTKNFFHPYLKKWPILEKIEITIWGSFVSQKTVSDILIDISWVGVWFWVGFWWGRFFHFWAIFELFWSKAWWKIIFEKIVPGKLFIIFDVESIEKIIGGFKRGTPPI